MQNVIFAALVATIPLVVAWTWWPRDRLRLSAPRRVMGTLGLSGVSCGVLIFVVLALYARGVGGGLPDGALVNAWASVNTWLAIASFLLCMLSCGVTRITGGLSASFLSTVLVLATWFGG